MWCLYRQSSQELCNMQRLQHGVHINFAQIWWQLWKVQTRGMVAMVFVQEVGHLLCEVAQLHVPPDAHHVSVEAQPMRFLPPLRRLWVISPLHLARAQMFALTRDTLPVGQAFRTHSSSCNLQIPGPRRLFQLFDRAIITSASVWKIRLHITTHHHTLLLIPWIADPGIRVVSFRLAWTKRVPPSVSQWLKSRPGPFTFVLWVPSAAFLLIKLPYRIISAADWAEWRTEWIFSQTKYSKFPALRKGNKSAHICTNLLPNRSRRVRSIIVFPGHERLKKQFELEYGAQWIMTCCLQSKTSFRFQSYLYRWYHSSNSKTNLINSWTGLISSKPAFSHCDRVFRHPKDRIRGMEATTANGAYQHQWQKTMDRA